MISRTTRRFREAYGRLPEHVQRRAREAYRRFKDDPSHPRLRFKQVHATHPIYAARVGLGYRALAVIDPFSSEVIHDHCPGVALHRRSPR